MTSGFPVVPTVKLVRSLTGWDLRQSKCLVDKCFPLNPEGGRRASATGLRRLVQCLLQYPPPKPVEITPADDSELLAVRAENARLRVVLNCIEKLAEV
jgi:hypothetical protein